MYSKHTTLYLFLCVVLSPMFLQCSKQQEQGTKEHGFVMSPTMLKTTQTADARPEPVAREYTFFGKIMADNNRMVEVFPVVGGNVTHVYVELGDYVHKGDLLATIRSTEVAGFEKDLDDAQADLLVAKNRAKVAKELYEGKINTEREVIEAASEVEKAQTQLNRIQATFNIYNIKRGAIYEVRSPLSGFIIQKSINEGMLLRSDKTDNIFDIAQIDDVWAIANVSESDISKVNLGVEAKVTALSYPDTAFYGQVDKIFNVIDPETKAMKARVKLANRSFLLKPDMRTSITLKQVSSERMLAIPAQAVIFDKGGYYVMVYKSPTQIETRSIQVYAQTSERCYVQSGLQEGEKVLTTNQLLVYDALND
ncbi:MAG: hypothetical protein RL156_77 [Bacteroidota bacterium]